jgi:Protein of unknown function, DUF481
MGLESLYPFPRAWGTRQGLIGRHSKVRAARRRRIRRYALTLGALALFLVHLSAVLAANTDKVTLLNGDIITCKIQNLRRGILHVGTDSMGDLDIEWTDVVSVTSDQHLLIETADGTRYFGRLVSSGDPTLIKVEVPSEHGEGTELREVVKAQVVLITPIEEKLRDKLDVDLNLGYSFTKSSDVAQFTFGAHANYRARKYQLRFDATSIRTTQQTAPASRTQEAIVNYRYFLKKRWFALALGGAQENTELGVALRTFAGGGGGRKLIQTTRTELVLSGALTAAHEEPTEGSDTTDSIDANLGLEYRFFMFKQPKRDVLVQFALIPSLTESGRVRSNFTTRFRLELIRDFFWQLQLFASTDNQPPAGAASDSDYGIITAFGYSF